MDPTLLETHSCLNTSDEPEEKEISSDTNCVDLNNPPNTTVDQLNIDALSSAIILQLPFPSMPIVATNGEGDDAVCSSHDLLSRAIAVQQVTGQQGPGVINKDQKAIMLEKQRILLDLHKNIKDTWQRVGSHELSLDNGIQSCYELYHKHFRSYLALYPIFTTDIRFLPIESVDNKGKLACQARKHFDARSKLFAGDDNDTVQRIELSNTSGYKDIILAYIYDMASYE